MKTFKDLGLSEEILKAIEEMGYENPMPVQEKVIPYLLGEGNDVVALAQTGTGKTAAFGLPTIQKTDIENRVPQTLILCPTRELCLQIAGDLSDYSKYIDRLKVLPVYGGSSIDSQIRSLKRGVHIVVATPGRLLDLMRRKTVQLGFVKNVIMDEADEMLNMGFTESINAILSEVPKDRNTLMFSATMSSDISVAYTVHAKDKYMALKRIADSNPQIYGIVFCRTRKETQEIADKLIQDGYNADSLHGELSQAQRDTVMQKFRVKHLQILVATDVAARGLDVDDLTHVINYGLPDEVESYTHRSGRTGRAGKTGISIVIINLREKGKLRAIEHKIGKQFEAGVIPTGTEICEKQLIKVIDELEKVKVSEEDISAFLPEIYRKLEWLSKEDLIKRMVSIEFNRFLEYYRNADKLESPTDNGSDRRDRSDRSARQAEPGYVRLFINMGKMDGFYANQVIELINHNVRTKRVNIGRIDLMKNFSFFEVAEAQKDDVLEGLNNLDINGRRVSVEVAGAETSSPRRNSSRKSYGSSNRSSGGGYRSKDKPSRSDRGYTSPRGAYKGKDRKRSDEGGYSSDRNSEGWARRKPNKR